MWNGCSEMNERMRKKRGEILNEDGKEITWMKEIRKGDNMDERDTEEEENNKEGKGWKIGIIVIFFFCVGNSYI
jgi:hypothetical protein